MLVGDLIYNDELDCDCNYEVYDCTSGLSQANGAEIIFSTKVNGFKKPLDQILDMKIESITANENTIIIEATR